MVRLKVPTHFSLFCRLFLILTSIFHPCFVAKIGNAAQSIGSGGFIEGLLGTLKTIGLAITFPISLIADLLSFVYSVSVFVFSLLGFVPA